METVDLRKEFKELWNPPVHEIVLVTVPAMLYLMIEGTGDPETSPAFREAVQALYTASYTMKFSAKIAGIADWKVPPLEGLWRTSSGEDFTEAATGEMSWKALIMQPKIVTTEMLEQARAEAVRKKKDVPALALVRLESWEEGLCIQTMHVGPYAAEHATISMMHKWIAAHGYRVRGIHHELYLSDPNRTRPENLKTILRQPVETA